jgi:glycosyltransferase involved in cell wall biosynthesis
MNAPSRVLALIPAYNEARNLPAVVGRIRERCPGVAVLVVDDGSTDDTMSVLEQLGVQWLRWPHRRGVGCAVRAGLRYGSRLGFDVVVRLDADGQHDAEDIERLLAAIRIGRADAVFGSRYAHDADAEPILLKRMLARLVSAVGQRRITDATSGFWALGPRAVTLLATHHPRGYPEPELHLFLSRNRLRVEEVGVAERDRLSGRSSLTALRLVAAAARVLLAMVIVPLRARVSP